MKTKLWIFFFHKIYISGGSYIGRDALFLLLSFVCVPSMIVIGCARLIRIVVRCCSNGISIMANLSKRKLFSDCEWRSGRTLCDCHWDTYLSTRFRVLWKRQQLFTINAVNFFFHSIHRTPYPPPHVWLFILIVKIAHWMHDVDCFWLLRNYIRRIKRIIFE